MDTEELFWTAVDLAARLHSELSDPALLPSRMAWAAARVLVAEGAGLSLSLGTVDIFRVPLGSSDEVAAEAERLQFTTGEGPCLEAHFSAEPVMAGASVMAQSWPVFATQLSARTPFRSIYATPIPRVGTMDVYFTEPDECRTVDVGQAKEVATLIGEVLTDPSRYPVTDECEEWAYTAERRRHQVTIAVGMVSRDRHVTFPDALALLRAHAFLTDRILDDIAHEIVTRALPTTELGV